MENELFHLQYAMDTFYFLICGALVMWMAAGFTMLESGLVRSKTQRKSLPRTSLSTPLPASCISSAVTRSCTTAVIS